MHNKITVGIIGGAGLAGGELLRILSAHPDVFVAFVHSHSHAGYNVGTAHPDLHMLWPEQQFIGDISLKGMHSVDVLFLCVGHKQAENWVNQYTLNEEGPVVIDLSQDHRVDNTYLYGLTELVSSRLADQRKIANPGCFATAIQLPLYPFIESETLGQELHVTAITGSTGAGYSLSPTSHFNWRSQNLSVYKAFNHQHLDEIYHQMGKFGWSGQINFIPVRGCLTRGIIVSTYFHSACSQSEAIELLNTYYEQSPFVQAVNRSVDVKSVVNTNYCLIQVEKHGDYLHCVSVIDNLIKGASGQAVQNMNGHFKLDMDRGLRLKPIGY